MDTLFPVDEERPLRVSELTGLVSGLLEAAFPQGVWVVGEVSNLARPSSGHLYLKLKDAHSQVNAVIYRGVALRLRFDLRDGLEVEVRGRLIVYAPRGEYQLQVEEVRPKGIGALELAFRQLKERLSLAGYFDSRRKRPLPLYPRRVVLVTSPTGAAVRDMLEVLQRRWPAVEVWICPVPVQGDGAANKIADALHTLNRLDGIDVLIVGRGGGSLEDLWPFNEEVLAQAIFTSRIPVVSGVGHETDLTIADLVADVRALTPTEAAERVVPDRRQVSEGLRAMTERLRLLLHRRLDVARARLEDLAGRRCFRHPGERIAQRQQQLDDWQQRLDRATRNRLELGGRALAEMAGRLEALSPLKVLRRGYTVTRKLGDPTVLRHPHQVQPGEQIETLLAQGRVLSRVEEVHSSDAIPVQGGTNGHGPDYHESSGPAR